VPHLSLDEVRRDLLGDVSQWNVRNECDTSHLPLQVAHEAKVANESSKVLPTGELSRVHDDAAQRPMYLDPWVDVRARSLEVFLSERPLWLKNEDTLPRNNAMRHRGSLFGRGKKLQCYVALDSVKNFYRRGEQERDGSFDLTR
jgi:hypothetical protein